MKEKDFQKGVIEILHRNSWTVAHFTQAQVRPGVWATPVQADGKGFPDLICLRDGDILVIELKAAGRKTTPEQEVWLREWGDTVAEVYVFTPADYPDRIVRLVQ